MPSQPPAECDLLGDLHQPPQSDFNMPTEQGQYPPVNPFVGIDNMEANIPQNNAASLNQPCERDSLEKDEASFDPLKEWGMPDGLPAPTPPAEKKTARGSAAKTGTRAAATTKKPETTRKSLSATSSRTPTTGAAKKPASPAPGTKRAAAATTKAPAASRTAGPGAKRPAGAAKSAPKPTPVVPFYLDLTYVPGNGSANYVDGDFFRRVRARYYVISALEPCPDCWIPCLKARSRGEMMRR